MRLLFDFAYHATGTEPLKLDLEQLHADLISAFLHHVKVDAATAMAPQTPPTSRVAPRLA